MIVKEFRQTLNNLFERSGLTVEEAAVIAKTAPGTFTRWLQGHTVPAYPSQRMIIHRLEEYVALPR